jgi:hypothetical protein
MLGKHSDHDFYFYLGENENEKCLELPDLPDQKTTGFFGIFLGKKKSAFNLARKFSQK